MLKPPKSAMYRPTIYSQQNESPSLVRKGEPLVATEMIVDEKKRKRARRPRVPTLTFGGNREKELRNWRGKPKPTLRKGNQRPFPGERFFLNWGNKILCCQFSKKAAGRKRKKKKKQNLKNIESAVRFAGGPSKHRKGRGEHHHRRL